MSTLSFYKKKLIRLGCLDFLIRLANRNLFAKTLEEAKSEIEKLPTYERAHASIFKKGKLQPVLTRGMLVDMSGSQGNTILGPSSKETVKRWLNLGGNPENYLLYIEQRSCVN